MRILTFPLALVLLVTACAGAGHQLVTRPALESSVAGDRCRVFVAREENVAGSIRNVRVFDGETEIGVIDEQEFLCWERKPARGFGRVVFDGVGLELAAVENLFDLPREPGTTGYYSIRIPHEGHKPEITLLSAEAGQALIDSRSPATMR